MENLQLPTLMGTIKLAAVATVTVFSVIMRLRDALFAASQSAALAPRKEVPSLIPGSQSRPADIFLPNWCRGQPAALDVTVISTMQPLTLAGAAAEPGFALKVAEARKLGSHNATAELLEYHSFPL